MDVLDAIRNRRSVRSYSTRAIPPDVLERMRQALRWAPSACNYQPRRFIFVTDPELRRNVATAAADQLWMADAPITVVACSLPDEAYKRMGGHRNAVEIDVAIALDHLTLAAVADGLGTCWIGAFDEEKVRKLLDIPRQARIVALTPLGYPAAPKANCPLDESERKPASEVFAIDRWA